MSKLEFKPQNKTTYILSKDGEYITTIDLLTDGSWELFACDETLTLSELKQIVAFMETLR